MMTAPVCTVLVDTEEEFDWSRPFSRDSVGVTSIEAQPLMLPLFRRFGIVPTHLVDWPVATTPAALAVLRPMVEARQCEIGAHLHPWVNPPHDETVCARHSYPGNLPPELEFQKLHALTCAIEGNFGLRPTVYRAGRYGIGANTAAVLESLGFETDCSVVPHTSFAADGGPDFRGRPDRPHWFGSNARLLEIPLSTGFAGRLARLGTTLFPALESPWPRRARLPGIAARLGLLERIRLTPEGNSLEDLCRLTRAMAAAGHRVFSFCYHSPSLQPGHTPYVRTADDLRAFVARCEGWFRFFVEEMGGRFAPVSALRADLAGGHDNDRVGCGAKIAG